MSCSPVSRAACQPTDILACRNTHERQRRLCAALVEARKAKATKQAAKKATEVAAAAAAFAP